MTHHRTGPDGHPIGHGKAEACQLALADFAREAHRQPDSHEKAHLLSQTIQVWQRSRVAAARFAGATVGPVEVRDWTHLGNWLEPMPPSGTN